jgi:hypothetical protein
MPRPPIHPFWVERIRVLLANNPRISGVEIRRKLTNDQKIKKEDDAPTPVPSDRAIRRIMTQFKGAPKSERQSYRYFSWPESMEAGILPWEAARVVLDLMRFRTEAHMEPPLVLEAQWFWRVTLAIPDAPIETRVKAAAALVMLAMSDQPKSENLKVLQWRLAYQTWRSKADREAYLQAAKDERIPATSNDETSVELEDALPLLGHYYCTLNADIVTF